ncbi:hypothetical protein HK104_009013 [Borealophlyctis nickersoniae]|nr:hypothetical protein HK104_009013 [Borealophlyctis nickersoniae]
MTRPNFDKKHPRDDSDDAEETSTHQPSKKTQRTLDDFVTTDRSSRSPSPERNDAASKEISQEDIFRSLRLRRIVRENHGADINQCAFFVRPATDHEEEIDASNILATVGGAQANIYDNEHCGDHLDIMSHFVVDGQGYGPVVGEASEPPTQVLLTCCWLSMPNDAVLAAGGSDNDIHVLSIARSMELQKLVGHTGDVVDLQAHPTDRNLLLSLSKDRTVRIWHVGAGRCLAVYETKATAACLHPYGTTFATACADGSVHDWEIPEDMLHLSTSEANDMAEERVTEGIKIAAASKLHAGSTIDCMRFVGTNVLSKSVNGKILLWNPETTQIIHTFNIKGGGNNHCRFDIR